MFHDSRGRAWVSVRDIGLTLIENNKKTHFGVPIINSSVIQAIAEDPEGNIWLGHRNGGLNKIAPNGMISDYQLGFQAGVNDIYAIAFTQSDSMWLGTRDGLYPFNRHAGTVGAPVWHDSIQPGIVRYIAEASNGDVWLATHNQGVIRYTAAGVIKTYDTRNGMSTNIIRSVYVDRDDPLTVWIGTETSGLVRLKEDTLSAISTNPIFPDHNIHFIDEDAVGFLWISTNRGILRVQKEALHGYFDGDLNRIQVITYTRNDGLRNNEFNGGSMPSAIRASDGTYWLGGQGGISIIRPSDAEAITDSIPIVIERVEPSQAYGKDTEITTRGDVVLHFTGLNTGAPHQVWYRYRLLNFNDNWVDWVQERSVGYYDLSPGRYIFEVQATGLSGVWPTQTARVFIYVPRMYYQSVWFYFLLIGLAAGLAYGIAQFRIRSLEDIRIRLSRLVDQRTNDLNEEKLEVERQKKVIEIQASELELVNQTKDRFFSIIGHDLRSPFQTLLGLTEIMLEDYDEMDDEERKLNMQRLRNASQNLHRLVENLLEWSSIQSGKIKPDIDPMELKGAVINLLHIYEPFAGYKNIEMELDIRDELIVLADRNFIDTVLRNLVSNAIKFTNPGGSIRVRAGREADHWWLEVSDTGIGMKPEMVQKLMKIDKSTKRRGTSDESGTGLGLVICRELVEMVHGHIEVVSEEGKGTMFKVIFPRETIEHDGEDHAEPIS